VCVRATDINVARRRTFSEPAAAATCNAVRPCSSMTAVGLVASDLRALLRPFLSALAAALSRGCELEPPPPLEALPLLLLPLPLPPPPSRRDFRFILSSRARGERGWGACVLWWRTRARGGWRARRAADDDPRPTTTTIGIGGAAWTYERPSHRSLKRVLYLTCVLIDVRGRFERTDSCYTISHRVCSRSGALVQRRR